MAIKSIAALALLSAAFSGCLETNSSVAADGAPGSASAVDENLVALSYTGSTGVQVCIPTGNPTFCILPVYQGYRNNRYDVSAVVDAIDVELSWTPASMFTDQLMLRVVHAPGPSTDENVILGKLIGPSPLRITLNPEVMEGMHNDIVIAVDPPPRLEQELQGQQLRVTPVAQDFMIVGSYLVGVGA